MGRRERRIRIRGDGGQQGPSFQRLASPWSFATLSQVLPQPLSRQKEFPPQPLSAKTSTDVYELPVPLLNQDESSWAMNALSVFDQMGLSYSNLAMPAPPRS